jgi:L-ribulose-5-phosphate 4-epimerase
MLEELKQEVYEANVALQASGLVILTWGNVSGRDPETGLVVIKPSGVEYDAMRPEDMIVVDPSGKVVEGEMRPSSDTPTHLVLYREFAGIGGVAHTHSTCATAWAQALRPVPCYGTTHADSFRGEVPVTAALTAGALAGDYEEETGLAIVRAFEGRDPREMRAVLVASHGPFTWGPTAAKAVENSIVLEQIARMAMMTETLRAEAAAISRDLRDKHFLRKHGPDAYYGQEGPDPKATSEG